MREIRKILRPLDLTLRFVTDDFRLENIGIVGFDVEIRERK